MSPKPIVTRFAPSPTGSLHIGGARTALFNWAYARRHGGTFVLRIEDTDQKRSSRESTIGLINDLKWLGLDWDAGPDPNDPYNQSNGDTGPYFQSQRLDLYNSYIKTLIDVRRAYHCFKTPDELTADREQAKREKRAYKYDHTESFSHSPETIKQYQAEQRPSVIRFRMPDTDITVNDQVLGPVTLKADQLEDFIIQKSDGFPTFHLANVVDDAAMGITHVLRGQEHLMNTPKHVALQQALGFETPTYAHMPLIFNPDGSKMSKRDKAKTARQAAKQQNLQSIDGLDPDALTSFLAKKNDDNTTAQAIADSLGIQLPEIDVLDFQASGYLPGVLLNYVALLGWSPGDNVERFEMDFLVQKFNVERIGKSNARFDRDKLQSFNTEAITALAPERFHDLLAEHDTRFHDAVYQNTLGAQHFHTFAESYRERSRSLEEPFTNGAFFINPDTDITYIPKAVKKVLKKNDNAGFNVLADLHPLLQAADSWTTESIEKIIGDYASAKEINLGNAAQPLRVAVTGSTVSPPIYDTLAILGQTSTINRIKRCLEIRVIQLASDTE